MVTVKNKAWMSDRPIATVRRCKRVMQTLKARGAGGKGQIGYYGAPGLKASPIKECGWKPDRTALYQRCQKSFDNLLMEGVSLPKGKFLSSKTCVKYGHVEKQKGA